MSPHAVYTAFSANDSFYSLTGIRTVLIKTSNIENKETFSWNNFFFRQTYPTFERLIIGCKSRQVSLILDLCKSFKDPIGILYVLLVSRLGNKPGRYQTPSPLSYSELELFMYEHQEFFEQDARHHIWISSMSDEGQFIYDQHNYIYYYGDINKMIAKLKKKGFKFGEVTISVPHCHNYHVQFDDQEEEVLKRFEWLYSPLQDSDDP